MLIGLMGKKRSGKDSAAQVLISRFGFQRVAFADPLKESIYRLNPYIGVGIAHPGHLDPTRPTRLRDIVDSLGWEYAKEIPEVRRVLQEFGVGIREMDSDFWVRAGMAQAEGHHSVVVTDVRFPNEAEAIRDAGGTLVKVLRPDLVSTDTHVSETALDGFEPDAVIMNDGTLDDLELEVESLFWRS